MSAIIRTLPDIVPGPTNPRSPQSHCRLPDADGAPFLRLIPLRGWNTHPLTPYLANGQLTFSVRWSGTRPDSMTGIRMELGFRDRIHARNDRPEHSDVFIDISSRLAGMLRSHDAGSSARFVIRMEDFAGLPGRVPDNPDAAVEFDSDAVFALGLRGLLPPGLALEIVDILIASPDLEPPAPVIKIDQAGYHPQGRKRAIVSFSPETLGIGSGTPFRIYRSPGMDEFPVFSGRLAPLRELDSVDSGETLFVADFSDFSEEGRYRMAMDAAGIDPSSEFAVSRNCYGRVLYDAFRYYLYQRAGMDLMPPWVADYPRKDQTPMDRRARFDSGTRDPIDVHGGWYDAGDKGKYVNAAATAIADLLWAWECHPGQFTDGRFDLPESGRGIPDLLSELRWELEWMLRMQDAASGGFWARVQSSNDRSPDTERFIRDREGERGDILTTSDTSYAAAALAHAARVFGPWDSDLAGRCLQAARRAWGWLSEHPHIIASPPGPYTVKEPLIDLQGRLWAAAALFRSTGEEAFHRYFREHLEPCRHLARAPDAYAHYWTGMWTVAWLSYLAAPGTDPILRSALASDLAVWCGTIIDRWRNHPWGITTREGQYVWGSVVSILNVPMAALLAKRLLGEAFPADSRDLAAMGMDSLHWILGANPLGISFVTGHGERSVKRLFSNIYSHDGVKGMPPGYLAGGPNSNEGRELSRFAARCYLDSPGDWVCNEHTIYWNSPLVFMLAWALDRGDDEDRE